MKLFFVFLLTITFGLSGAAFAPTTAHAKWSVKSQFELALSESFFNQVIKDFWSLLQGSHALAIKDITTSAQGFPVYVKGIHTDVNYDFPLPVRTSASEREWELSTNKLSAQLTVDSVTASGEVLKIINGIRVRIRINAECHDIKMHLPDSRSHIVARVRAEAKDGQVKLTLPAYDANWQEGSWVVDSMNCTGVEGFDQVVKAEALKALSSFHNFDGPVKEVLAAKFDDWSKNATAMLFTPREIPSGSEALKIFFEPANANEGPGGMLLGGNMRFEYPMVAPGQTIESVHALSGGTKASSSEDPRMLMPFATLRSLAAGSYLAGQLKYSLNSSQVPTFRDFMNNPVQKLFGFPELNRYSAETKFNFAFSPAGTPSLSGERMSAINTIQATLSTPLSIAMQPEVNGKFIPMVNFRTQVKGPATFTLKAGGKINLRIEPQTTPLTYAWDENYLRAYNPTQYIAADTIAEKVRAAVSAQSLTLTIPALQIGPTFGLQPSAWELQGADLSVSFGTTDPIQPTPRTKPSRPAAPKLLPAPLSAFFAFLQGRR